MRPVLRWLAGAAVVGIGAGVGAVALAADGGAGHYRLATVAVGDVTRTVAADGTVDVVNRADVSFGTGGTVASLSVRPGRRVRAGQRLGTLDTAALQAAADSAAAAWRTRRPRSHPTSSASRTPPRRRPSPPTTRHPRSAGSSRRSAPRRPRQARRSPRPRPRCPRRPRPARRRGRVARTPSRPPWPRRTPSPTPRTPCST